MDNYNRLGRFIRRNPVAGRVVMWLLFPAYLAYGVYLGVREAVEEFHCEYKSIFK